MLLNIQSLFRYLNRFHLETIFNIYKRIASILDYLYYVIVFSRRVTLLLVYTVVILRSNVSFWKQFRHPVLIKIS